MSGRVRAFALLLALTGLCAWSGEALAVAKYARVTGNWGTAGTWSTNPDCTTAGATTAPTAADAVTICPGVTVTMDGNSGAALSLTIDGTANWAQGRTTNVGAGGIVINGDITGTANGILTTAGGLTLNGVTLTSDSVTVRTQTTGGQSITGTGSLARLAINATTTNNATLTVRTVLSGTSTLTNAASQTLNIGGATTTITGLTANTANNVVNYYAAGNQTLRSANTTYHHLTLSGSGTKSSGGITLQVNGTTTVTGTATFNISNATGTKTFVGPVVVDASCSWTNTANELVTFSGGITHNGTTFSAGTGLQTFDINSQVLAGASAMSFGGAVTVTGAISLTNNNSNTVTIGGTLNGTAAGSSTFVNGTNATLNYGAAAAPMVTGVLTAGANPNTVNYNSNAAQSVRAITYHHLTKSGTGTATAAGNITVNGNFTITGGAFAAAALSHVIKGNFSNSGTFTASTSSVTLNGTAAQTIGGTVATTFYGLTVNNAAGVSLSGVNATASNLLTLQSGVVTTGAQILVASANCPGGVARTSGHVAGNLQLRLPTGTPSCTFHVGDASDYRPIDTTFASVTATGNLTGTVSQSAGEHPDIATSGLDSATDVNRYWTLTNPVGGTIAFTTYTSTFNFINPGDFDVGATFANFEIERWDGAAWNNTTPSAAGATSTAASGLPSLAAGGSNSYAVGEKKPPFVVSIILASPDPTSPATLVDWTVTFNASVTGVDATDFSLVMGGGVSGASITGVSGSGTTWTVTASTGAGAGTLGLNLVDNDTIVNAALKPLGGTGSSNGNFTGQAYTVVYTASGFVFTSSVCTHNVAFGIPGQCAQVSWSPQVAGQSLTGVYITSINTSGVPTRLHASQSQTRNIEFGLSCHNPATNAGVQASFAGATLPLCQANGATPATWSSMVTVTFPGGSPSSNVSYIFNYADVGSVELWMRNNAIPTETGNSGAFVVKPYGFTVSVTGNPVAADATGAAFVKAGASFTATVTAIANGGTTTPNYGKESTAEGVILTAALVPGLGLSNLPALSNATIAGSEFGSGGMVNDANGVATVTNLAWNEVGIIRLTPSVADASYLGAGDVTGTVSANVGRFYPDHFTLSAGSIATRTDVSPACSPASTFSYMNEPFQAGFTLTASGPSPGNATLLNYVSSATAANNFAKLATGAPIPAGFGLAYLNSTTNLTTRVDSSLGISGSWVAGVLAATATLAFTRDTVPDGPYSAMKVGIAPADSDGVVLTVLNMDVTAPVGNDHAEVGETQIRFGRLRLLNAYGSELLPLRVPVRAEHFNGTTWALNAVDNCTTLPSQRDNLAIGNHSGTLTPANYGSTKVLAAALTLSGGLNTIVLAAPAAGTSGSADIALNLNPAATTIDVSCNTTHPATVAGANLPWLQGNWCGVAGYVRDPGARIKFGSPKAPYIYLRERY